MDESAGKVKQRQLGDEATARDSATMLRGSRTSPLVQKQRWGGMLVAARQQKRHTLSDVELAGRSEDKGRAGHSGQPWQGRARGGPRRLQPRVA